MSFNTKNINPETDLAFDKDNIVIQQYSPDKKAHKVIVVKSEDDVAIADFIHEVTSKDAA